MGIKRVLGAVLAAMLAGGGVVAMAPTAAEAAAPTAPWSSGATGSVVGVTAGLLGLNIAGLQVSSSNAAASSTAANRTRALSQNIGAAVAGISIPIVSSQQIAPPQQPQALLGGLGTINASPIVTTGIISSTNRALWSADTACVTTGQLSSSNTTLAGLDVLPGVGGTTGLLSVGTAQTTSGTSLAQNAGLNYGVSSTASGTLDTINVLDAATIEVLGATTLTATSSGTGAPTVSYTPSAVRVTLGTGAPVVLALGATESVVLPIAGLGSVTVALNRPTTSTNGNAVTASTSLLTVTASLLPVLGVPTVSASVPVLPLTATATAPTGGIDCPPPPAAPAITAPATGTVTANATPAISGTAVAGSTVTVYSDGTSIGTATATAGGTWSLTPATPLAQGGHTLTATATTAAGTSGPSNAVAITIDQTAPAAPVVTGPANGSSTSNARPPITGTAEAGSTVTVRIDGADAGTVTATPAGTFSFAPTAALGAGAHTASVTATDAAGNVSVRSNQTSFTVDTTAPPAPVVITPANGSTTTSRTPTLSGTAEAGSTVRVTLDGTTTVTTTATAGGSWSVPAPTLADGSHSVVATSTDAAGNVSVDSNTTTFTVDATAPAAPVVATPANGSLVATRTPPITGTAEPNATVTVSIDGTPRGTTTANGAGAWTFASPTLGDGSHTVNALATDPAGNAGPVSNTNTFVVDATAPAAPVVTAPANGSTVSTRTPALAGTSEANALVTVTVDGVVVGTATASPAGSWSLPQPTPLADGSHTVNAVARDAAGNVSAVSATNTFAVDATAPAAPVITAPANGASVATPRPPITGTAEPGSIVTVTVDGAVLGTATTTGSGAWTLTPPADLAQGPHTASATARDAAGNTGPASGPTAFTVDTLAPIAPVVLTPPTGSVVTDRTPTITGTAEPGAAVRVSIDGALAGTTTASASGVWSFAPTTDLADGAHTANVVAVDAAGNVSPVSNTVSFTVNATASGAPTVTAPADGSTTTARLPVYSGTADAGSTVTVLVDGLPIGIAAVVGGAWTFTQPLPLADGAHTVAATSRVGLGPVSPLSNTNTFTVDATAPVAPVVATPANGAVLATRTPPVTGTAEPGSTVSVSIDGVPAGSTTANGAGAWTLPSPTLADGSHSVSAVASDAVGNTSPTSNVNAFTVDATAPAAPVVTTPANGSTVSTRTPALSGTSEANALVTVTVDGIVVGTVTASSTGAWTLPQPTPLGDGTHTVSAVARDAAGNVGPVSNTSTFTVDATAPGAPIVSSPVNGTVTTAVRPPITGTAEAGSTVTVRIDGVDAGTTPADAAGAWTFAPPADLAQGPHTASATATDGAGNTGPRSNTTTFTVDSVAPAPPVILTPANGAITQDRTPVVTGTAEPGSTVRVTFDGGAVVSTTASGTGTWNVTAPTLADGAHAVFATATDAAGNTGVRSATTTFTVDATAPAAPVITTPANGSTVGTRTPTYTGTAEAGSTVTVSVDGTPIGTVVATGGGWSIAQPTPLGDGGHTVTATSTDAAGNVGLPSAVTAFTVDATAPAVPVVVLPANGSTTSNRTPPVSGSAEPNSTVTVLLDGAAVGTAPVNAAGAWTFQPVAPLADGPHSASAFATDGSGNVGPASAPNAFAVDATAPAAPTVTAPLNNAIVPTRTPILAGTAEPGSVVRVLLDGATVGTVTATASGVWTLLQPTALTDGVYVLTAIATDDAGNSSPSSNARTFSVDATAPAAPVVTTPADGSVTASPRPVVSGTAEAGSTVDVVVDGASIGTTTADGSGAWSLTPTADLGQGGHTVSTTATDGAGTTGPTSNVNSFTVDSIAPAAPTVTAPANGSVTNDSTPAYAGTAEPGSTVTVTVDGAPVGTATADGSGAWTLTPATALTDGSHQVFATAADAAGNTGVRSTTSTFTVDTAAPAVPVITAPASGATLGTPRPVIGGTAEAGSTVTVRVDGTVVGTAVATGGAWTVTPTTDLVDGAHTATAVAVDAAGNASSAASVPFTTDTAAPAAPVIATPASGSTTGDSTPAITGTAEAGTSVAVSVDGTVVATVPATGGSWTYTPTTPLTDGTHTVSATATDAAGNTGPTSPTTTFTVDTTAPSAPVITTPANGSTVSDARPTITGTAEPNSTVTVSIDGVVAGTAATDASGAWSLPSGPLAEGTHLLSAAATDRAGNTGPATLSAFTVDTVAPAAPVITVPVSGSSTNDPFTVIEGTAEPFSTVAVSVDGVAVGTAAVPASGRWTLRSSVRLADGARRAVAVARDLAGNTGPASAGTPFIVDTIAPAAPVVAAPSDGSVTTDTTPTIAGTAEPGSTVTVQLDGAVVGTAVAGPGGAWTLATTVPLALGAHTVAATATDAAGNTGPASPTSTFQVDPAAPAAPVITAPADGSATADTTPTVTGTAAPGAVVTVVIDGVAIGTGPADGTGAWSVTPTVPLGQGDHVVTASSQVGAGPVSASSAPITFSVDTTAPAAPTIDLPTPELLHDTSFPDFAGTAEPDVTVTVIVEGEVMGTAVADSSGRWSLRAVRRLADGRWFVTAVAADDAGNLSPAAAPVPFVIDTTAPDAPTIASPADGSSTSDPTPTITGRGEPGATVTVVVDGRVLGTSVVAPNGTWSFTPTTPLSFGPHRVTATATDAAGNVSPFSIEIGFRISTVTAAGTGAALASTGVDDRTLLDLTTTALLLMVLGGVLLIRGRRRRADGRG